MPNTSDKTIISKLKDALVLSRMAMEAEHLLMVPICVNGPIIGYVIDSALQLCRDKESCPHAINGPSCVLCGMPEDKANIELAAADAYDKIATLFPYMREVNRDIGIEIITEAITSCLPRK